MKRKIFLVVGLILAIAAVVAVIICRPVHPEQPKKDSLLEYVSVDDLKNFAEENNLALESRGEAAHLYNVEFLGQVGYFVADYNTDTNVLLRTTFYTIIENDAQASGIIDEVKTAFLHEFGFTADYEYFPLEDGDEEVGESAFWEGKASKELFVFEENATWNISWMVTDEGVSGRISKSIT